MLSKQNNIITLCRKTPIRVLLSLFFSMFYFGSIGQTKTTENNETNIIKLIEEESDGNITINISEDLFKILINPQKKQGSTPALHPGVNRLTGYRIQVFSDGRNQNSLEARAKARGNAIVARFPKYRGQVYSFSQAPNWYTRIGNFRTAEEASEALKELKQAFPAFSSEMRTVRSQIVIIK